MADDTNLSLLVGQLQGGFREVKQMLIDQNQQHVRDKEEAKADRERRHNENRAEMQAMRTAMDSTAAVAQENRRWIAEKGEPLLGRVQKLEDASKAEAAAETVAAAEKRGWLRAWAWITAKIAAIAGGIVALIWAILENLDTVVAVARRLFGHHGGAVKTKAAAAGAVVGIGILVSILWGFEGNEPVAYLDPVGIPTVCVGHTGPEVRVGDRKTDEECRALLTGDALAAWDAVERMVTVPLQPYEHAAFASFTFNVGENAFLHSTMLRLINAGRVADACRELPKWVYASGTKLPGLVKRREAEMRLCLGGGV